MAVTYAIDLQEKIIRTLCTGDVTMQEVVAHFRELREDPNCPSFLDVLLDVAKINILPDARQIQAMGIEIRSLQQKVRFGLCAVIAPRDALYGMLRVFQVVNQDYFREIRVFRTAAEAEEWLSSQRSITKGSNNQTYPNP